MLSEAREASEVEAPTALGEGHTALLCSADSQDVFRFKRDTRHMLQPESIAPLTARRLVTIDLVGDLDAELGDTLAKTLDELRNQDDCDVLVNFKRVVAIDGPGLAGATRAIAQSRLAGSAIFASAARGNRRVRGLLKSSRIPLDDVTATIPSGRHIIIARHTARS